MEGVIKTMQNWIQDGRMFTELTGFSFGGGGGGGAGAQKQDTILCSVAAGASIFVLYLAIVRHVRYKSINAIRKKYPNSLDVLNSIDIAREISANITKKEFPFLSREASELALFKTFSIPSISKLLVGTGEFKKNCTRRAEDTEIMLMELTETYARIQKQLEKNANTPQDDIQAQWQRPGIAMTRLNELHGKYTISNDDYLYTLSLFIFEPISWINRYEWRQLDEREVNAIFRLWYEVGVGMKLQHIPNTPDKMLTFKNEYADKYVNYAPTNWKCGEPTFRHLLSGLPSFLVEPMYHLGRHILPSVLDPADAKAFQLPQESKVVTLVFKCVMSVRAFFVRHFMLPRSVFISRTPFYPNEKGKYVPEFFRYKPHIYKEGYSISELGPEKFEPLKCPFTH